MASCLFDHCVPVDVGQQTEAKPDEDAGEDDEGVFGGGDDDFCKKLRFMNISVI